MDRKRIARVGAAVLATCALGAAVVAMGVTYAQDEDVPAVPSAVMPMPSVPVASDTVEVAVPDRKPAVAPAAAPDSLDTPAAAAAEAEAAHPAVIEGAREIMELEPLLLDILDQQ
jgi:hypothetical protein